VNPEKPLSVEHWVDSAMTVMIVAPVVVEAATVLKEAYISSKIVAQSVNKTAINPNPFKGKSANELTKCL